MSIPVVCILVLIIFIDRIPTRQIRISIGGVNYRRSIRSAKAAPRLLRAGERRLSAQESGSAS